MEKKILKCAADLHEDMRNYASLKDMDKPLLVAGILIALKDDTLSIDGLNGDNAVTDGEKLLTSVRRFLRGRIGKDLADNICNQLLPIFRLEILNRKNVVLGVTPMRHFTEYLFENIFGYMNSTSENDYLGQFYSEFMSYSGGDGQTLGIVLTPKLLTELFCELAELKDGDVILDPCCGTGGFLIAGMQYLRKKKQNCILSGVELQPYMHTISVLNILLRDGNVNHLFNGDFLQKGNEVLDITPTVGLMNPPFSQGSRKNKDLYEICFVEHLLDTVAIGGKCVVVVPQSTLAGKTKDEQEIKDRILESHTLEGTILLNEDLFYGVCVETVLAVFTAGIPHPRDKVCKFINFKDDGYQVIPHVGRVDSGTAFLKKQRLLDVWFGRKNAGTEFCIRSQIQKHDEWLFNYYYYNNAIPERTEFIKTVQDALIYDFKQSINMKKCILPDSALPCRKPKHDLMEKEWKLFHITDLFDIKGTRPSDRDMLLPGKYPYITSQTTDFGHAGYYSSFTEEGGVLTVESSAAGYCAYQDTPFSTSGHIEKLIPKFKLTPYNALFFTTVINKNNRKKYSYGYKAKKRRLKKTIIVLPVTEAGTPDLMYMEEYINFLVYHIRRLYIEKFTA